jgi:hypothetical protein
MAGGAPVDRRGARLAGHAHMTIDGDVWRHDTPPKVAHELSHVVGFVRPQRDPAEGRPAVQKIKGLLALGRASSQADRTIHHQSMAVLHQRMPHVAELGRLAVALLVKPRVRIRQAAVCLVRALLLVEVPLGIAARSRAVIVAAILAPEALDRRPGLQQRAVHREVIARQQPLHFRLGHHRRQELRRDLALQQPVAVLREARMVPSRVVHPQPHEPAEQKVELHPLHQLALRPDAVKRLQQHRPKQSLRRDRWTAKPHRVQHRKVFRQVGQGRVRDRPDRAQWVVRPNPCLKVNIAEQRTREIIRSAHHKLQKTRRQ